MLNLFFEVIDDVQVSLDHVLDRKVQRVKVIQYTGAVDFVRQAFVEGRKVVLLTGDLDVSQEAGTLSHEVAAPPHQVARGAHGRRVDIRGGR